MIGRIVEIGGDGRHLALHRGFLVVRHAGTEVGRTPIDDVSALIGNAHGLSYSNNLLVALAERGCPFVLCGAHHHPVGILWPVEGHHRQAARMDAQLNAKLPLKKRLWKQIVQAKIRAQASALEHVELPPARITKLVSKVRAGDPSNVEAQAARAYWSLMFGKEFRRDRATSGINAQLNYGYTILRATVARHLMAAGLHPGLPVAHANESNPMRLVDDLMEPFRPLVDLTVRRLQLMGVGDMHQTAKRELALLPARTLLVQNQRSPVTLVIQRLCTSLAQVYEGDRRLLELPPADASSLFDMGTSTGSDIHHGEAGP